ncbi:DUF6048 family protein [Lutibacter flavus]|uniref:Outer membrane protein beta-barrel domain-containing protein n=1 Tax=Lutibacter flavus TaxID=691689 RepID=A0A238VDE3_9FLAO|nr:DUF6048 family protein [Lutibacter flavus]SNR32057.1 hypothetical protein SAMN04488111_0279 [Lutibacter flavus]
MTQRHILIFIISIIINFTANSQQKQDSLKTKVSYGIRVGVDISKPIISFIDSDNKGLELTGDIKFSNNYYAAVELGYEDALKTEDYFNYTAKGSFIKIGVNYNAYENWKGMNNEIYVGTRYAFSLFSQTLNSYTPNYSGIYFNAEEITPNTEFKDLNAHWIEFLFGMKVETFKNLYLGAQFSIKKMISSKEPENFKNLYVPGFNQVSSNDLGVGFNYTISYNIPIINKYK